MTRGKPKEKPKGADRDKFGAKSEAPASAPSACPEELATVWDDEIALRFQALRPQQQNFLLAYLQTGNSAEAYRQAYNKLASDHLASVAGSRLVASVGIEPILSKFASYKTEALFTVVQGYREMAKATNPKWVRDKDGQWENVGDAPDWQARKEAYLGIRKVHGLDQPAEVKTTHTVQSLTDDQLDAKIAAALLQAGAIAPAGGEGPAKAHA
jgi:hypothetical protein